MRTRIIGLVVAVGLLTSAVAVSGHPADYFPRVQLQDGTIFVPADQHRLDENKEPSWFRFHTTIGDLDEVHTPVAPAYVVVSNDDTGECVRYDWGHNRSVTHYPSGGDYTVKVITERSVRDYAVVTQNFTDVPAYSGDDAVTAGEFSSEGNCS